jgi:hypothetical protein
MRERAIRAAAGWLANQIERHWAQGVRCETYDLDDFPDEPYQPRDGLYSRCALCWVWDIIDNLRDFAR